MHTNFTHSNNAINIYIPVHWNNDQSSGLYTGGFECENFEDKNNNFKKIYITYANGHAQKVRIVHYLDRNILVL